MFPGDENGKDRATALRQREHARREVRLFIRRLGILLIALGAMVIAGTIGFAVIEHVSPAYGFEWTIDTVTTLGSIPDPPDAGGRALKVGLELFGIGTLFYALATVAEFFVSGQLSGVLEGAPDREDDQFVHRPLHRLRLRPRRAPGRARPADGRRQSTS